MVLPLSIVLCVIAVGPSEDLPTGRERPAEDHEFFRPISSAPEMSWSPVSADRFAPTAAWIEWLMTWWHRTTPKSTALPSVHTPLSRNSFPEVSHLSIGSQPSDVTMPVTLRLR
jgi:hypothetical protein